jgi:hypothetical protein
MSRPSSFTQQMADEICELLANGNSLRYICRDDAMPSMATVFRWLVSEEPEFRAFRDQYARAREAQADYMAEDILAIADETDRDTIHTETGEKADSEWIARSRLRVDARKWLASKMAPKKYGDKLDMSVGGIEGAPAVQVNIVKAK